MNTPLIYAHRGAHAHQQEMSHAAYQQAIHEAADGFECDVRLTSDGILVLWHDENMKRIVGDDAVIARSTLLELSKKAPIMTADELLRLAIENRKDIAFETKHPVPTRGKVERELIKLLKGYSSEIQNSGISITIMSFSWWSILAVMRSPFAAVQLVWNQFGIKTAVTPVIAIEIDQIRRNIELVRKLKAADKRVYVWTVNDEADARLAQCAGVDVIITDFPEKYERHSCERQPNGK